MLDLTVSLCWNRRCCPTVPQILAKGVTVISLVRQKCAGVAVPLFHQRGVSRDVVSFARRQDRRDRQAIGFYPEMDFRREPAARATRRLILSPPFWPAAQRCARIVVLSIICNRSASPPLSATACSISSRTPLAHQRRNCRETAFQSPNSRADPATARPFGKSKRYRPERGDGCPADPRQALNGAPGTAQRLPSPRRSSVPESLPTAHAEVSFELYCAELGNPLNAGLSTNSRL